MTSAPAQTKWSNLPTERDNRRPWHDCVEKALKKRLEVGRFTTIPDVLADAGIPPANAPAQRYVKRMLDATTLGSCHREGADDGL